MLLVDFSNLKIQPHFDPIASNTTNNLVFELWSEDYNGECNISDKGPLIFRKTLDYSGGTFSWSDDEAGITIDPTNNYIDMAVREDLDFGFWLVVLAGVIGSAVGGIISWAITHDRRNTDNTKKCSDGTRQYECSTNKPKYCNNHLQLVDRCGGAEDCGCPGTDHCCPGGTYKDQRCYADGVGEEGCCRYDTQCKPCAGGMVNWIPARCTMCYIGTWHGGDVCCPDGQCRPNADLSASLSADSPVNSGDTFTVTMTVSNAVGSATANNVAPSSLSVNTLTGDASATCGGHSPTSANIPGGSSQDFKWTCTASGEEGGTLNLSASASGIDACTGETVTASSTTSNTVTVEVPEFLFGLLIPLMSSVLIYFSMRGRIKKR